MQNVECRVQNAEHKDHSCTWEYSVSFVSLRSWGHLQLSEKIGQLKMPSADGTFYATDCANTGAMFRIIQFIPTWLAIGGFKA